MLENGRDSTINMKLITYFCHDLLVFKKYEIALLNSPDMKISLKGNFFRLASEVFNGLFLQVTGRYETCPIK